MTSDRRSWCEQQRLAWIAETIMVFGFINRDHLMRKFGISMPQASKDLTRFQHEHPGRLTYNLQMKRYEPAE